MENVDANGLTEAQFLAEYKQKDYPKPSLTADMAVFRPVGGPEGDWEVLLIRRGGPSCGRGRRPACASSTPRR